MVERLEKYNHVSRRTFVDVTDFTLWAKNQIYLALTVNRIKG